MLLAADRYKDFIGEEGIAVGSLSPLLPLRVYRTELDTPQPNYFSADSDPSLSESIFNVSVAEMER